MPPGIHVLELLVNPHSSQMCFQSFYCEGARGTEVGTGLWRSFVTPLCRKSPPWHIINQRVKTLQCFFFFFLFPLLLDNLGGERKNAKQPKILAQSRRSASEWKVAFFPFLNVTMFIKRITAAIFKHSELFNTKTQVFMLIHFTEMTMFKRKCVVSGKKETSLPSRKLLPRRKVSFNVWNVWSFCFFLLPWAVWAQISGQFFSVSRKCEEGQNFPVIHSWLHHSLFFLWFKLWLDDMN